jgi:hypothetical protein
MDEITTYVPLEETREMCHVSVCASGRAGHTVLPIQERVASASPSAWRDAIVTSSAHGTIELVLFDGETRVLWNHDNLGLTTGEPVAWHPVAGVLAAAGQLRSALPL